MAVEVLESSAAARKGHPVQRYKVRIGMFAWLCHRLSGLAITLYLAIHVWGLRSLSDKDAFNALIADYHAPIFKFGKFMLLIAVVYHAINGMRIVLIDFLGWSPHQKKLFFTLGAVAALLMIVGGYPSLYALVTHFTR